MQINRQALLQKQPYFFYILYLYISYLAPSVGGYIGGVLFWLYLFSLFFIFPYNLFLLSRLFLLFLHVCFLLLQQDVDGEIMFVLFCASLVFF